MFVAETRTFDSLKKLWGLSLGSTKPILIWVGAGASSWLEYERWADLADRFHRVFLRSDSKYVRVEAAQELEAQDYPAVFQRCRDADAQRYSLLLSEAFRPPRAVKPVYERFLAALRGVEGVSVLTTNVDENLERSLPHLQLVQRSDLARTLILTASKTPFIAKLHGTVSAVTSTVFTTQDYTSLVANESYIDVLRYLLTSHSVVFVGYSLRDQYLFDLLARNSELRSLFGDGPHFLISAEDRLDLPESVNTIRYRVDLHTDHRSSILAIELLRRPLVEVEPLAYDRSSQSSLLSGHFLSDLYPGGTWTTGNRFSLQGDDGRAAEMLTGPDWSREEMPITLSTAANDLAVGLICFDRVFLPLDCVGRIHQLLGSQLFWDIVSSDVLRFVRWEGFDGLMFLSPNAGFGHLTTGQIANISTIELITRQVIAAPGRETEAAARFEMLERKTERVDLSGALNFADVCNGLFVSPATRRALGLSEATPAGQLPRWLAGPAMRLVQIARVGATCQMMSLSSIKIMAGAATIAQIAFSAIAGGVLANDAATYALTGQFGILAESVVANPDVWMAILRFRDTSAGSQLRAHVHRYLQANEGAQIVAAIDASMRQALPSRVLTEARIAMSALLVTSNTSFGVTPGIWSDAHRLWDGPTAWRLRARARFESYLGEHKLGIYDLCPCGSYEKVKYCCQTALA